MGFFKIGITAFGGPATSVSLMEEEVVQKRNWMSCKYFLDLMGVTNLIPGPNSVEMAFHIGYVLRGWLGLFVAGISYSFPGLVLSLILAVIYVSFSSLPELEPILYGIKPVIIAIILAALIHLGKAAATNWVLILIAVITLPFAYFLKDTL
ncbi:MAG: chromate transporter [Candidatus Thorarchaeota archaeon]